MADVSCVTCIYFDGNLCRKNPPSVQGFPRVRPNDWCGEYVEAAAVAEDVEVEEEVEEQD